LEIICREQLFLKPEKCTFDAKEVEYLGMIIKPGHVTMDPTKLDGIRDWPVPTTVKENLVLPGILQLLSELYLALL
jgi:hypothetical protein